MGIGTANPHNSPKIVWTAHPSLYTLVQAVGEAGVRGPVMDPHRYRIDLLALAVLPHLAVEADLPRVYEKFLDTKYPNPPAEDLVGWVTEELTALAIAQNWANASK